MEVVITTVPGARVGTMPIPGAPRERLLRWGAIRLLCAACVLWRLSSAATEAPSIQFTATVPTAPARMRIYKLAPTSAPLQFLNEKLAVLRLPALRLEKNAYVVRGAIGDNDLDRVRAFANPVSGDTHFIPNLVESASPAAPQAPLTLERAVSIARAALSDERFIPKDVTELRLIKPIRVFGGATTRKSADAAHAATPARTAPRIVLTIVPTVRYAHGFPVYGRGSRAVVSVANDGLVVGALRRWRTASFAERIRTDIRGEQVRANIERQLSPYASGEGTRATVNRIDIAYYDGNASYLQPVYYFEATIRPGNQKAPSIKVAGYVPIGEVLEPIPDLAMPASLAPTLTKRELQQLPPAQDLTRPAGLSPSSNYITLGEYANQDWPNNGAYIDTANQFLAGLTFLNSLVPGTTPSVARTQWYVAYPWVVVGPRSRDYLNSVNVAYTEPYGNWLYNTTLASYGEPWQVPDIGTNGNPGFGAAAGGALATWIIMSCEVIPSMYDRQNEAGATDDPYAAFDAWWPVFQGLHSVIGFRTKILFPANDLQFTFGYGVSLGGDVNAAWFQEVAANDSSGGRYHDTHLVGSPLVHYGRASTMIDARSLGQSIYNVGAQSAATMLWNFWMDD